MERLLFGCGEVTASVAARATAGPGDAMLRLDLGPVAAVVVVVVDAAVVRAVLVRSWCGTRAPAHRSSCLTPVLLDHGLRLFGIRLGVPDRSWRVGVRHMVWEIRVGYVSRGPRIKRWIEAGDVLKHCNYGHCWLLSVGLLRAFYPLRETSSTVRTGLTQGGGEDRRHRDH